MAKRMGLMLLVVGLFIIGIGAFKYFQIQAAIAQGGFQQPPTTVTTVIAAEEEWPSTLSAIGSVDAVQGVLLSADLSGVVREISFDSGRRVAKGATLLRLDTSQEQALLAQAEASRDLAHLDLDRARKLLAQQVIAQAEFDRLDATARQADANVDGIRATIGRKTLRAPFSGILGIRQVDLGQRLNEGDPIVPLQALDPVFVVFSLPQGDVNQLKVGAEVTVTSKDLGGREGHGRITAINSIIDPATRNVEVQATLRNPGEVLRPGMFVDVRIELGTSTKAIPLPSSAIAFAPYGNSVYVVEEMKDPKDPKAKPYKGVNQRFVKLGRERGDQVAVVEGLKPGDEVVSAGAFKLRPGIPVVVDNKIQPGNEAAPKPADS